MKKRHVVKNLSLSEISGVTTPAQSHALVSLWKSEDMPLIDEITKRLEAGETPVKELSEHLSKSEGETKEKVAHFVASSQLGASRATSNDVSKYFNATEENSNMSEELVKKAEGLEAQVAELTAKLEKAESVAKLTEKEREYMSQLDEEAAEEFRAAAKEKRDAMMKKSADSDELFKSVDGVELRKSAVGEHVFAMFKANDEALRATRTELAKQADRAQTVEFTKKADEDFANLPGETLAKVAVLKGMHGMDDASRTTLEQMLKAGNDALAKGFQNYGVTGGKPSDITKATKLAAEVKKLMDADANLTKAQAEVKAISANPDLYEG